MNTEKIMALVDDHRRANFQCADITRVVLGEVVAALVQERDTANERLEKARNMALRIDETNVKLAAENKVLDKRNLVFTEEIKRLQMENSKKFVSDLRVLAEENKVLRDALNNCEDALMNSQALIGSHRVGFEKTCFEANDLALHTAHAALTRKQS